MSSPAPPPRPTQSQPAEPQPPEPQRAGPQPAGASAQPATADGYQVSEVYRSRRLERREHPTFVALAGFFTGVVLVVVVPTLVAGFLRFVVGSLDQAESFYPLLLLLLLVPLVLVSFRRTRHFGTYLLIGIVSTAVVVVGVAAVVLFVLFRTQGGGAGLD